MCLAMGGRILTCIPGGSKCTLSHADMGSTLGHRSPVFLHTVPLGKQTHAQKHSLNASNYSQTILRGRKQQFRQTDISKVLLSVSLCLLSNFKRASLCVHAALLVTSPQVLHSHTDDRWLIPGQGCSVV